MGAGTALRGSAGGGGSARGQAGVGGAMQQPEKGEPALEVGTEPVADVADDEPSEETKAVLQQQQQQQPDAALLPEGDGSGEDEVQAEPVEPAHPDGDPNEEGEALV